MRPWCSAPSRRAARVRGRRRPGGLELLLLPRVEPERGGPAVRQCRIDDVLCDAELRLRRRLPLPADSVHRGQPAAGRSGATDRAVPAAVREHLLRQPRWDVHRRHHVLAPRRSRDVPGHGAPAVRRDLLPGWRDLRRRGGRVWMRRLDAGRVRRRLLREWRVRQRAVHRRVPIGSSGCLRRDVLPARGELLERRVQLPGQPSVLHGERQSRSSLLPQRQRVPEQRLRRVSRGSSTLLRRLVLHDSAVLLHERQRHARRVSRQPTRERRRDRRQRRRYADVRSRQLLELDLQQLLQRHLRLLHGSRPAGVQPARLLRLNAGTCSLPPGSLLARSNIAAIRRPLCGASARSMTRYAFCGGHHALA